MTVDANGATAPASQATGDANPASGQGEGTMAQAPNARPDNIPEKFWDGDAGALKQDDLLSSYSHLEKKLAESTARPEGAFASLDDVKLELPQDFKLPEGVDFNLNAEDASVKQMMDWAFKAGATQEEFSQFLSDAVNDEAAKLDAYFPNEEERIAGEMKQLGAKAQERIEGAERFLKANLPEDQYEAVRALSTSAKAVEALETIMGLTRQTKLPSDGGGDALGGGGAITEDILNARIADKRHNVDMAYTAETERMFQKFYNS